jgi:AraC-like DNA-binding protein
LASLDSFILSHRPSGRMSPVDDPLNKHPVLRRARLNETLQTLSRLYAEPQIEIGGEAGEFRATLNNFSMENISLSFSKFETEVRTSFPETDITVQVFPLKGAGANTVGRRSVVMVPGKGIVLSSGTSFQSTLNAAYERLILRIGSHQLKKTLQALTGKTISAPIQFDLEADLRSTPGQILYDHVMSISRLLNEDVLKLTHLTLAEIEQLLIATFLRANRHNYTHLFERDEVRASVWQVRRAQEYLEANWQKPLDIEDLVKATGVSARSLYRAFRQNGKSSPMMFLRELRLRHARRFLQRADKATTVTEIALACGFGDPGRFSREYRRAFGELPSDTLKLAR